VIILPQRQQPAGSIALHIFLALMLARPPHFFLAGPAASGLVGSSM